MSTPKKDWIFTAVLVVLIAGLSAVVVMRMFPAREDGADEAASGASVGAQASRGDGTPAAAASDTTGSAALSTPVAAHTPAPAAANVDTTYSPTAAASRPAAHAAKGTPSAAASATSGTAETASADAADPFPFLGAVNPFDPIVTPTPSPPPPPPPTPLPNNLERALANYVLDYPAKGKTQWVFQDKSKPGMTYTVEVGKPYHLKDVTEFDADVTANGKWGVQFEYKGQVKKFSMVE